MAFICFINFFEVVNSVALGVSGLPERGRPLPPLFLGLLCFLLPLGKNLSIFSSGLTVLLGTTTLQGNAVTLALQHDGGHQSLDLGCLEFGLLLLLTLFGLKRPLDDILGDIVLLGEIEELANLGRTLGSQATRDGLVGQA